MSVFSSRRRLLQTLLVAPAAAACTPKRHAVRRAEGPDVPLRAAAIAREQALLAHYRSALPPSAAVAAQVAAVLADHEEHLRALGGSASPTPSSSAPSGAPLPPAQLAAEERLAAAAHASAALEASPSLAALLASLAASEASHVVALT